MSFRFDKKPDRRDFLKFVGLGAGALAFRPYYSETEPISSGAKTVRVTIANLSVYKEPWDESEILYQKFRDDLLNVYYEVNSEHGPGYNPIWYRVWGGYVHSGHTQVVETRINEVDYSVSSTPLPGKIGEVTVPFTQSRLHNSNGSWEDVFRLYYQSVHWVVGVQDGPDGRPWYRIKDEIFDADRLDYYVPAEHIRIISDSEISPISPEVPWKEKRIEISIGMQQLIAYEYDRPVLKTKVSTGIPSRKIEGQIPTATPTGTFNIQDKMPSKHMGDGKMTADLEAYELPGVPWVCFFEPLTGVATHGTYWHTNFGMTMSHGCVNMRNEEAKWIYRWAYPQVTTHKVENIGYGTKVVVS